MTATNIGGESFTAPLTIATSVAPGGSNLQGTGAQPFSCEGLGGGAICSQGSATIAPGQSLSVPITFKLPRNAGGQVTTCANIAWGGVPSGLGPREVQRKLNELGFNAGPADGRPGRKTVAAIRAFQKSAGISQTGQLDLPLYLALFSPGGSGDANPGNDQACAGAAVIAAPVATAPAWKPPRGYQRPKNPATTGRCSSRSVWLEGQCILKSQVASFCGPGFSRQGSRCVSNAGNQFGSDGHLFNKLPACPANTVRVGNSCVRQNTAPVFGNFFGGGTTPTSTGGGTQTQSGGNQVRTGGSAPCPYPYKRNAAGKCDIVCSGGRIRYIQSNGQPGCKCRAGTVLTATQGGWYSVCLPPGQKKPNTKCPPGQVADLLNQSRCYPACSGGKIRIKGICCAPGSGVTNGRCTYYDKNQKAACKPGFTRANNGIWCRENSGGQPQQVNVPQQQFQQQPQVNCTFGRVANANGQCVCPNGLEWRSGKCRTPKIGTQILKQLTQPQQNQQQIQRQPQTRQQQQQQQIQQGIGNMLQQFSDVRLKRDITHLVTRDDGLKVYSFRYLWDEQPYVGVMAQDLLADPAQASAVSQHESGYYMVDYKSLGLKMVRLEAWRQAHH